MEPVNVVSDTAPLWSVELPAHDGTMRAEGVDGCLVIAEAAATLIGPDGHIRWSHELGSHGNWYPLVRDGRMHRIEDDRIVTRDLATGEVVASFDGGPRAHRLEFDPWGGFVFRHLVRPDQREVRRVGLDGELHWAVPLPGLRDGYRLRAFKDFVVFDVDKRLYAYDRDGELRWAAWAWPGVRLDQPADKDDRVNGLWDYDANHLLARFDWYAGGGYYLVDAFGDAREFITTRQVSEPLAVLPGVAGGPVRLAVQGPTRQQQMIYTYPIWMIEGDRAVWTHDLDVAPVTLTAGTEGTLIVSASPDQRRWDTYHWLRPLWHETFVRCLNADGTTRWTWYAPGVITQHPELGRDGTVYVGAAGRLYALPG
ncbi:PQQ-binding-like beta-propeller repeat protein [Catellatospora vulcania]|uniref:PQQ-binding-like beta-propeller repeat protein n=1 Tax=Catellatospora vulcania TaxID=1460450 RepID=UPI0012D373E5|nr:PQQ-binding-like beta-propeller repeat protein [Catellatospora vulcania]